MSDSFIAIHLQACKQALCLVGGTRADIALLRFLAEVFPLGREARRAPPGYLLLIFTVTSRLLPVDE